MKRKFYYRFSNENWTYLSRYLICLSRNSTMRVRLYGDALSVDNFANVMTPLTTKPEIKDILATAQKQQASVLFYSTPWSQLWSDPLALAFAQKLQYTAFLYGTPAWERVNEPSSSNLLEPILLVLTPSSILFMMMQWVIIQFSI